MKNILNLFNKRTEKENVIKAADIPAPNYRISICIPHSREFISTESAFSILALSCPPGITRSLTTKDIQPINHCRNEMVKDSMENPSLTHVLMIEPNIKIHPGILWEMLMEDADIVSVPCFDTLSPHNPNIYQMINNEYVSYSEYDRASSRLVKINATDPGCVLIKKSVFDKITPWFIYNNDYKESDMFLFTKRANEAGMKLLATRLVQCHRMANIEITYGFFKEQRAYLESKKNGDDKK